MNNTSGKLTELQTWIEAWKTCLQGVLAQVRSQPIAFEITSEPLPPADDDLHFMVTAGGAAHGEMCLRIPSPSAICLARLFLGQAEPTREITAEHKEALEELLRQIAGVAATTITSSVGGEVQLHLAASSAPSWSPASAVSLGAREKTGETITLELQMSPALAQALPSKMESKPSSVGAGNKVTTAFESSYERLRGVALDVRLRFGTRRMQLRDVLALNTGIVVELDSKVQTPADLLLDGRVIARGEVVVVDGKYGLRVRRFRQHPPRVEAPDMHDFLKPIARRWTPLARPACGLASCSGPPQLWHRIRRPAVGALLQGVYYCQPRCLEIALDTELSRLQSAHPAPLPPNRIPLGLMMVARGKLTYGDVQAALEAQRRAGADKIGDWIEALGFASEQEVSAALALQWGCPVASSPPSLIDAAHHIPLAVLENFHMIPWNYIPSTNTLQIGFGQRIDHSALYAIEQVLG